MQASDSGQSQAKLLLNLAVLAALVYVAIQSVPVYVNNYKLEDYMRRLAIQASVTRSSAEEIQDKVLNQALDLKLPVARDQIKVQAERGDVKIEVDYTVPVDLKVYTWVLHFTPSSANRSLT